MRYDHRRAATVPTRGHCAAKADRIDWQRTSLKIQGGGRRRKRRRRRSSSSSSSSRSKPPGVDLERSLAVLGPSEAEARNLSRK
eukprot:6160217-Pyramimonas_sp.AAC.1